MQTINSVPFSRMLKYSLSLLSAVRKQKQMKPISLNYLTGHIKKMIHVFHSNEDSFDMIFITIIQPKIHKGNGFLRICFQCFYFNLFSLQNNFLSGHNSKKQSHIFFLSEAVIKYLSRSSHMLNIEMFLESATQSSTYSKTICCTFSFRSSRSLISFRSSHTFFKKHWNVYRSSHTSSNIKKYQLHGFCTKYAETAAHFSFKSSCTIYTVSSQNLLKIFS